MLKVTIYVVVRGYHAFNKKPRNYLLKVKKKLSRTRFLQVTAAKGYHGFNKKPCC